VYDIADLYKAEVTIPAAFEMASKYQGDELGSAVRRRVRDLLVEKKILERMVHDIRWLMETEGETDREKDAVYLWDERNGTVPNGISYGKGQEEES
jgi:CRISPR-associated protein Cas1